NGAQFIEDRIEIANVCGGQGGFQLSDECFFTRRAAIPRIVLSGSCQGAWIAGRSRSQNLRMKRSVDGAGRDSSKDCFELIPTQDRFVSCGARCLVAGYEPGAEHHFLAALVPWIEKENRPPLFPVNH